MYYRMYLYVPIYFRIQKYRNQLDVVLIKRNTKNCAQNDKEYHKPT